MLPESSPNQKPAVPGPGDPGYVLTLDGITFAGSTDLYAPVRELGREFGMTVGFGDGGATLNAQPIPHSRALLDSTHLMPVSDLRDRGATVIWDPQTRKATVTYREKSVMVFRGPKRVELDKATLLMKAYQGQREVLETRFSPRRRGYATPNGTFTAGPYKARMHLSSLYDDAPMPYSVQVEGNVFIHGYSSVPNRPASHGCIRLPLDGGNPARWFYNWVDVGTPITVDGVWRG